MQAHNANDTFTGSATFLHSSPKSVPILYNDPSFPSLKMPLVMGIWEQQMMTWQWHQLNQIQITCTLLQTDSHISTSPLNFFAGQMRFLMLNQQHRSTGVTYLLTKQ